MSGRGKKSKVVIADHTLTFAELSVLKQLKEYMLAHPKSDVRLQEIFPGPNNAKRHSARHLSDLGVLKACQLDLTDDLMKWVTR